MLKKSQKDIRHIQTPARILDIDVFERTPAANYSRVIAKTKIPTKRGYFSFGHRSRCEWFAVAIFTHFAFYKTIILPFQNPKPDACI